MPPKSRLSIAKKDVIQAIEDTGKRIFTRADLEQLLAEHRQYWRLTESTTTRQFIEYLTKNSPLEVHRFDFPNRPTIRYSWGSAPTLEIVQSLRPQGYFTHFSAIQLHGLTEQLPKTIYLNFEQHLSGGGGNLTQENIHRAFRGKCRVSRNATVFRGQRVCLLNGQNTGQLGVTEIESHEGATVRVADIERTLIDITVRPVYSGGPFEVARVFKAAHGRFSVNRLVSYLRKLNFTYPYHQAIGFYLQHAEVYRETQLELLRQFDIDFDFYLTHEMREPDYAPEWRLFIPKGF
jgi:hypothetical protein